MRLFHSRTLTAALVVLLAFATLALASCGQGSGTNGTENTAMEDVQVMLPPSIKRSHSYRCRDNSLITIDFLSDHVTINLRSENTISRLKAPRPGEAFTDGRHVVDGDGANIELIRPGKEPQTCKI